MEVSRHILTLHDPIRSAKLPDDEASNEQKYARTALVAHNHFLLHRNNAAIAMSANARRTAAIPQEKGAAEAAGVEVGIAVAVALVVCGKGLS